MNAINMLESVLCDPEGKCCITGSEADRKIVDDAITELRAALAQPEQLAVAWRVWSGWSTDGENVYQYSESGDGEPLYTHPAIAQLV